MKGMEISLTNHDRRGSGSSLHTVDENLVSILQSCLDEVQSLWEMLQKVFLLPIEGRDVEILQALGMRGEATSQHGHDLRNPVLLQSFQIVCVGDVPQEQSRNDLRGSEGVLLRREVFLE